MSEIHTKSTYLCEQNKSQIFVVVVLGKGVVIFIF